MGLLNRILKRQCFPVSGDDGLYVRAWKFGDLDTSKTVTDNGNWYLLGQCLTEPDGTPVFTRGDDEDPSAFASRVKTELEKIGFDILAFRRVFAAIDKVSTTEPEDLKKNTPTTQKPDSREPSASVSDGGTGGT
jgi:hypothetical protein